MLFSPEICHKTQRVEYTISSTYNNSVLLCFAHCVASWYEMRYVNTVWFDSINLQTWTVMDLYYSLKWEIVDICKIFSSPTPTFYSLARSIFGGQFFWLILNYSVHSLQYFELPKINQLMNTAHHFIFWGAFLCALVVCFFCRCFDHLNTLLPCFVGVTFLLSYHSYLYDWSNSYLYYDKIKSTKLFRAQSSL